MIASPHSFVWKAWFQGHGYVYIYIISMKPTEWLLSLFLSNFTESLALERTSILVVLGAKKKKKDSGSLFTGISGRPYLLMKHGLV